MKTIVVTEIKGDRFVATTPHCKAYRGEAATEHEAVNALIASIRAGAAARWDQDAKPPTGKDIIVRHLSGVRPPQTETPAPTKSSDSSKEQSDG